MADAAAAEHEPAAEMTCDVAEVRWAPRVAQYRIRRLYETDALGIADEGQIDDVGYAIYARCQSILAVTEAWLGRVQCPRCARLGKAAVIERHGGQDEVLRCPECGWQTTWGAYQKTFQRKQLHSGGALPAFQAYVQGFEQARTPRQKMLAIDRVIHEFHYSLLRRPDDPTRPAGVNLIGGTMKEVIALLDGLTYGAGSAPELRAIQAEWRENEARRRRLGDEFRARATSEPA